MSLSVYYPEMGETKPEAQIEASLGHYGRHWFLRTPLTLKGRGITFRNTLTADQLTEQGQRLVGWNEYRVTEKAFESLRECYTISTEALL